MAKKETKVVIALRCEVCKNKNYTTFKSKQLKDKVSNKKYCSTCRKHTQHDETKLK